MEGKLDEEGNLSIKRGMRWVNMHCPYAASEAIPCGEWCPQLSEPIIQKNFKSQRMETVVHICQGRHWKFTDFEDRREV